MTFMIAAYLIIWAAAFVFIFLMMRRQATIEKEIGALRELLAERKKSSANQPRGKA
jgi:CcmD family protein